MSNAVLVAPNASCVTENSKFRFEYQVVGGPRMNFDWAPTFGNSNAQLLASLLSTIQATILARHGLTIGDDEVIVVGAPIITVP